MTCNSELSTVSRQPTGQSHMSRLMSVIPTFARIQWPNQAVSIRKSGIPHILDSGFRRSEGVANPYVIDLDKIRYNSLPESAGGQWTRSRCPWHPTLATGSGAQHLEDAVGAGTSGNSGSAAAKPMGVHMLGDQRLQHFPQLARDLEIAGGGIGPGGQASLLGTWRLEVFPFGHGPSLNATPACRPEQDCEFAPAIRVGTWYATARPKRRYQQIATSRSTKDFTTLSAQGQDILN